MPGIPTTTYVGKERVGEKSGNKCTTVGDLRGTVCTGQYVVLEQSTQQSSVVGKGPKCGIGNLSESVVRWCKNGDVLCRPKLSNKFRNQGKNGAQLR